MDVVFFARHGESAYSARGALNGDPGVSCPLTDVGREQARRLGRALASERIDLCVTSEFERAIETADVALGGRDVPRLVVAELNDPRYGSYEGGLLAEYQRWAHAADALAEPPGGGESRGRLAARYARGLRIVLERPEARVLVVAHALPIRYVLNAASGLDPTQVLEPVAYAELHRLDAGELARAVERLAAWSAAPAF